MTPNPSQVHVNRVLSSVSIAYQQDGANFVADKVFPTVPVSKQSDLYRTYARADWNRVTMRKRGPATESAGGGFTMSTLPYYADVWALHKDIDDQTRANQDEDVDLDMASTRYLTHQALLTREVNWMTKFFATGIWGTNITGVAAAPTTNQVLQWSDPGSSPIENIRQQITAIAQGTGIRPNTLVLSEATFNALIDHPDIVDRVRYAQNTGTAAMVDTAELQALLKIPRIFVASAIQNSALEGATEVNAFVASKGALLTYAAPSPGLMEPSAGYTFLWKGLLGGGNDLVNVIKKFRMEPIESDRVEIQTAWDQKVVATDLSCFFATIVA